MQKGEIPDPRAGSTKFRAPPLSAAGVRVGYKLVLTLFSYSVWKLVTRSKTAGHTAGLGTSGDPPGMKRLACFLYILNTAKREPTGDTTNNRRHNKQTDDTTAQQYKHHSPHKATQHMTHASHTPNTQPRRPPSTLSLPHTSNSSTASSIAASDITAPKTTHCATCVTRDVAVGE